MFMCFLHLLIFWIKIFLKSIIGIFKQSPVIFIWAIVLCIAFFIGKDYINITLNAQLLIPLLLVLAVLSMIISFKNTYMLPVLIAYSKSSFQKRHILVFYFLKKSIRNNIFLIILSIFAVKLLSTENYSQLTLIPIIPIISVFLSFAIMCLKNRFISIKVYKVKEKKSVTSIRIKSILYDYLTADFLLMVVLGFALFAGIVTGLLKDVGSFQQSDNSYPIFIGSIAVLAFCFMGIVSSIPNINWKFYSFLNPQNLSYHTKKSALVLAGSFCLLLLTFLIILLSFDMVITIKYIYCLAAIMLFSIYNAFTLSHWISMLFRSLIFTILAIWISAFNIAFLLVLILPITILSFFAKNDYKERYFL